MAGEGYSEDYNFEELSCQFVRPTLSLVGHENKIVITLLSASLEVLTSQNVRTDLVLIRHLTFWPGKCQMSDCNNPHWGYPTLLVLILCLDFLLIRCTILWAWFVVTTTTTHPLLRWTSTTVAPITPSPSLTRTPTLWLPSASRRWCWPAGRRRSCQGEWGVVMWERCGQEWLACRKMRSSQATRLRGVWSCGRGVARNGWPVGR